MSPASESVAVIWPLMPCASSFVVTVAMGFKTGASLVLATVRSKVVLTVAPCASVAVTVTEVVPTSLFVGVPVKAPVLASKIAQAGMPEAVSVRLSLVSISAKLPAGIAKLNAASSVAV